MKKNLLYLAIGLGLIVAFSFLIQRSCHVSDRLSVAKGQYQAYQETARKEKQALEAEVKLKESEIQGYKDRIGRLELARTENEVTIIEGDKEIEGLENNLAVLAEKRTQYKDEIIEEQRKLILTVKIQLGREREDKATVIEQCDLWKAAYEKEHEISQGLKAQLDREESLRKVSEALNVQYEKRIQGIQFKSNIKTVVIAGLAACGGYLIKEGSSAK